MALRSSAQQSQEADDDSLNEEDIVDLLGGPFEGYAERLLKVMPKEGRGVVPMRMTRSQLHVQRLVEEQRERIHMVRALILKGRKTGISTWVGGRFYRRVTTVPGTEALIMAHEGDSTTTLFNMTKRFYNNMPLPLRPTVGASGATRLHFPGLDSGYTVGTAGSKNTGRSKTPQLFHGSEVAFWPNAEDIARGAMGAVPDSPGTEIILESTGNGLGNFWHNEWQKAEAGQGLYLPIFIPWFWAPEYALFAPPGWKPVAEELDYQGRCGLTHEQTYWMHLKNISLGGHQGEICWQFRQEYPANAVEAFQSGSDNCYIPSDLVDAARKRQIQEPDRGYAKVLGVDVAANERQKDSDGGDNTVLIDRQGRRGGFNTYRVMKTANPMQIVGQIIIEDRRHGYDMIFIDVAGAGAGVYHRLVEQGYGSKCRAVNFGSKAIEENRYQNRRAEMYGNCRLWFEEEAGVAIPADAGNLHSQLCSPGYRHDSQGRLCLEAKDSIRKRLKRSPDDADAFVLTFAEVVIREAYSADASWHSDSSDDEPATWAGL